MDDKEVNGIKLLACIAVCIIIFFAVISWISYNDPMIRLEHFAYLFGIVSSFATALTLIWLVVERNELQKEKIKNNKKQQAAGASAWLSKKTFGVKAHLTQSVIILNNNSDSPIYNVVASIVDARNIEAKGEDTPDEFRKIIDAAPPGQVYCMAPTGYGSMGFHPSVEIAFSDANNNHWVRRGHGQLEELKEDPFIHYKIEQPPVYESLHEL